MLRLTTALVAATLAGAAGAETLPVPFIDSDAWVRTGPSTAHKRIGGLPRGTPVLEIAGPETLFKGRSGRWVRVFVLEGRSAGREGWVWGSFVGCCKAYDWLE